MTPLLRDHYLSRGETIPEQKKINDIIPAILYNKMLSTFLALWMCAILLAQRFDDVRDIRRECIACMFCGPQDGVLLHAGMGWGWNTGKGQCFTWGVQCSCYALLVAVLLAIG